ncbi:MAG: ribbon-helix-helix domain-containing protein [Angustibacter sp.]
MSNQQHDDGSSHADGRADVYTDAAAWAEEHLPTARLGKITRGQAAADAGRRLLAAALGEDPAADDPAEAHARTLLRGGRPKLDPTARLGEHASTRQVRLPAQLDRALDAVVAERHSTRSAIIREAVGYYLSQHAPGQAVTHRQAGGTTRTSTR